jgi:hypothetical protein
MEDPEEQLSLKDQMRNVIEEARMVLPGIQALFGFQTIAVFNQRFTDLASFEQSCHLVALAMVVLAIALVMSTAAYHRIVEPHRISRHTVDRASTLICYALVPLAIGLALDMLVVLMLAAGDISLGIIGAAVTLVLLMTLWFIYPFSMRKRNIARKR